MSGRVLNLLPNAVGQAQERILLGEVSLLQPAPTLTSDFLYVTVDWNPGVVFQIVDWPTCHGDALPAPGDLALLIKDDQESLRCVWWGSDGGTVVPAGPAGNVVTASGVTTPSEINGNLINTDQIMQSVTDTFGIASASGYDGSGIPNQVGPVLAETMTGDLYTDSTAGNIFQFASYANNTGSRPTVAVFGEGVGKHAWGGNFCGFTMNTGDIAYAVELDTANLGGAGQASGQATGIFLVESTNEHVAGSPANTGYMMLCEAAAGATGWAEGIVFENDPVQSTGALLKVFAPVTVHDAIDFGGAIITNAAVSIPMNSGSTSGSTGILIQATGGFANAGNAIQVQATAASSTMGGGILFHHSASFGDPVVSTGSLIKADGLTCATGIDFSAATFTTGAIVLGSGGQVKFNPGTTGGGSALLGANSPAVTNSAPYTWLQVTASDGSQVYVPAWK